MTAFMLACYMNGALQGSIYFKSVNDCTFYSKLVPSIDEEKVKVY